MAEHKILIVDDDRDIRVGLNARLRANGYETAFAEDGVGAMMAAKKEQPDLILLDLGIPAGDGHVVLDRLKDQASLGTIPVIVLSARDARSNEKKCLDAGAFAYFEKPVNDAELLDAISRAINSHG